ncbi:MAG: amidohydrolase family protein [Acidimicrobiales bacterium]
MAEPFRVRGTIMQTPEPDRLEVMADVVVSVDGDGTIVAIDEHDRTSPDADVELPAGSVLLPGLIDTHVHAPQWPQLGTGLDLPLEEWLLEYTFPLEARFADPDWAAMVWPDLVHGLLAHGTTTAVYHAVVDVDATTMLAGFCADIGQRALVGRVAMDHPDTTPEWYRDPDAAAGISASRTSIDEIRALGSDLVGPIITPRFIPACTDELLAGLGVLAAETGVAVQTHCSESDWQHEHVLDRTGRRDTVALDEFGLLGDHTVLAHCGLVDDEDLVRIRGRGAGIAHCPVSNAYFGNAVFGARRALDAGVRVGLGSDVAGGAVAGLLAQCHAAVTSSRMLEDGVDPTVARANRGVPGSRIGTVTAFWMATRGGAELLGHPTGLLEVGRAFDAFAVDVAAASGRPTSPLRVWPDLDDDATIFEKVVRLATAADISDVWVAGRRVAGTGRS